MKMTSAYANKLIKKLREDEAYWKEVEKKGHCYFAAPGEEPIIPEYDFNEVNNEINEIQTKIAKLRHAINYSNATNYITVGSEKFTIDTVLVKMKQFNERKQVLSRMRKLRPKEMCAEANTALYQKMLAAYVQYSNFDMNDVQKEYERIDECINTLLLELDKFNCNVEFEVDI